MFEVKTGLSIVKDTANDLTGTAKEVTGALVVPFKDAFNAIKGVASEVDGEKQKVIDSANEVNKTLTNVASTKTSGGSQLKKMSLLLKKAANKLPSLYDINSKTLKRKVKSAKKKLLKASEKAHKASKKVRNLMMKGGILSRRLSRKLSSRKRSSRRR
jgi:hypothetical protein